MNSDLQFSLPATPASGSHSILGGLIGAAKPLLIKALLEKQDGPVVVLCPDSQSANQLEIELQAFIGEAEQCTILHLPDWETLPYDSFSPHQDIISERLSTLYTLSTTQKGLLIVPVNTACHKLAPCQFIQGQAFVYKNGDKCDLTHVAEKLTQNGYRRVSEVYEHGEFAVRGSILDVYPMGNEQPYRLDLFGDQIDSIRPFDGETQRSSAPVEKVSLLPAHEFPFDEAGISTFRHNWRTAFTGDPTDVPLYQDVSAGICPAGIEYYLPLFFDEETTTLFDYLPANTLLLSIGELQNPLEEFWNQVKARHEQFAHDRLRPLLTPEQLFLPVNKFFQQLKRFGLVKLQSDPPNKTCSQQVNLNTTACPNFFPDTNQVRGPGKTPFPGLKEWLSGQDSRVLVCAESTGRREVISSLLKQDHLEAKPYSNWQAFLEDSAPLGITVAPIEHGVCFSEQQLILIAEAELFGRRVYQTRKRRKTPEDISEHTIKNLTELAIGAAVVHIEHGVGRYLGLQTLEVGGIEAEFLHLEYASGSKLYVPVSSLHLISRYTGAEQAPLNKLGSGQWEKAKNKAATQVHDVAAELLNIYARREARKGHALSCSEKEYALFVNAFPFEETPDQDNAIKAVLTDMKAAKSMDRLVCGDVGFGKTEVAMRAAFVACQSGKQVTILVPTTLLAQQHFTSFSDRFADWPVRIEVLSRFRTGKQLVEIKEKVASGQIDILIGTHKLLNEDVKYKKLGLIIIDEEHRFGVRQKEKLKALRAEIDILTLTATPIPRTLNMAVSGLRDLSIICTPPQKRLAIKTFIRENNKSIVREAITREIHRGGQVYYLHNDVKTIERSASLLSELVPEARVAVGHGQMRERQLEAVMSDFYHRRYNVLVCTTIIETGIDIPSANTIIIERADKFGLAQLHQLRGRVGRSHHQAYAYLFTAPKAVMTADAKKRLEAIEATDELGAGFSLATHDLEIRGAGELLGEGQSGNIQSIGFSLYMDMLNRAVKALKSGNEPDLTAPTAFGTEIDCHIPALIPSDYLPDTHNRLVCYKRMAGCETDESLDQLKAEMIDRFGPLPTQLKNLFAITALKLLATPIGLKKVDANEEGGKLEFLPEASVDPKKLIQLIQTQSNRYKMDGPVRLRFVEKLPSAEKRLSFLRELLLSLHLGKS